MYREPQAWPLRECFPLPVEVQKKVDVFPLSSRYVCVVDAEGQLCAMSQRDPDVQHGPDWLERCAETVQQVLSNFETTRHAWARIHKAYDRREAVELAREIAEAANEGKGGVGDALMDLDAGKESKEDREIRMRAIFDKYDDDGGGTVDAEELEAVFKDMGIDVPEPDEMEDLLAEFSGGAAEAGRPGPKPTCAFSSRAAWRARRKNHVVKNFAPPNGPRRSSSNNFATSSRRSSRTTTRR